jgi:hypothetical protein
VTTIHAPFPTEVECRMASVQADLFTLLKSWPELQIRVTQLKREASPPPGLRLPQVKLSRNSNQVARGRIRWFESDMPSHAVVSNSRRTCGRPEGIVRGQEHGRREQCITPTPPVSL